MKSRIAIKAAACVFGAVLAAPVLVDGRQAPPPEGHQHAAQAPALKAGEPRAEPTPGMMAAMKDADRKLDDLVKTMNAAKDNDKIDAMAELLTTLVQNHRAMHESMMSGMADHACGRAGGPPVAKK